MPAWALSAALEVKATERSGWPAVAGPPLSRTFVVQVTSASASTLAKLAVAGEPLAAASVPGVGQNCCVLAACAVCVQVSGIRVPPSVLPGHFCASVKPWL